jgi:RHS repeat-associated protein
MKPGNLRSHDPGRARLGRARPGDASSTGFFAAAVLFALAFANGAAAQSFCIDESSTYICKKAVQYPARYAPLNYSSMKPECSFSTPPIVPPYSHGMYDVEGDAIDQIHDTQACDIAATLCDAGSMTPVKNFKTSIIGPAGYLPTLEVRADPAPFSSTAEAFLWTYQTKGQDNQCVAQSKINFGMHREQPVDCPQGYVRAEHNSDTCILSWMSQICPVGHPIDPGIGAKLLSEIDYDSNGTLGFSRRYYSYGYDAPRSANDDGKSHVLGPRWRTPYDSRLYFTTASTLTRAALVNDNGTIKYFRTDGSEYPHYSNTPVESLTDNGNGTWTLTRGDDSIEIYDAQGRLLSLWDKVRLGRTLAYGSDGRLQSVTDARGRVLGFEHLPTADSGRVVVMTTPAGQEYRYTIDGRGNLVDVTMPDGKQRHYAYTHPRYFGAITRITDENGDDYEAVTYDSSGRATSSWLAPGTAGDTIGRHTIAYSTYKAQITDALGLQRDLNYSFGSHVIRVGSTSQPCTSCGSNFQTQTYDANGYFDRTVDFQGYETDADYNARGLETQLREGQIAVNGQCPVGSGYNANNYGSACTTGTCWASQPFFGSTSAAPLGYPTQYYSCTVQSTPLRTTQTIWHATLREPVERKILDAQSQVETVTRWQYNARGQVVARCEMDPAAAAYVCDAQIGPAAGAKVRRWTYEYCNAFDVAVPNSTCPIEGLLKSVNGPRKSTDTGINGVDDLTTYTYYATDLLSGCGALLDEPCHRKGDLWKTTNALGHVTENMAYDGNGRLTRSKDANGTITDYTYHVRGWLASKRIRANASGNPSPNDAITTMTYDDAGNVTRVTQPDGAYLDYVYDAAHRLTDVVDNLGNRIHYTLDAAGNRVKEQTYDASYNPASPATGLKREMSRVFNQMKRLTKMLDANGLPTRDSTTFDTGGLNDGYDANGNAAQFADGLGIKTKHEYDPLNRLINTLHDYEGSDPETANAATVVTYDARNNVRSVTDPETLSTSYTYDGLGDLTDLDSPDTGHTGFTHDLAGNRIVQIDNRGKTTTYTFDAINRLTTMTFPTTTENVTFSYDEADVATGCTMSYAKGRMTRIVDASGTTTFCYDRRGNTTRKSHLTGGETLIVEYAYDKADRLISITYPSGGIATYSRDSIGRVVGLTWKTNAGATPTTVISNATYYPYGPLSVLTYGNGRTLSKSFDANYQIDTIVSSASDGLVLDLASDVMGNITAASSTIGAATPTRQYRYDSHYRLTRVDDGSGAMQEDYGYSKTGDRTLKQWASQTAQVYAYMAGTHRLGSIDGAARTYDANGNTTGRSDGKTLTYNDRNRLDNVQVGGTKYIRVYNGKGERAAKFEATRFTTTVQTRYVYDEKGGVLAIKPPGSSPFIEFLYINAVPVAQISNGSLYHLETDYLGTPRVAADAATGAWQWKWDYFGSSFGEHQPVSAPAATMNVPLRYPGQIADDPFDITYNYFRDYDPAAGRYLGSDPLGLSGGLSTYGYAGQSPHQLMDPYGLWCLPYWDEVTDWATVRRERNLSVAGVALTGIFTPSCKWPDAWHVWQERQRRDRAYCRECLPNDMKCPDGGETCQWTWKYGMWKKENRDFDESVFTDGYAYSGPNLNRCIACRNPFGEGWLHACDTGVYGDDMAIKKN